MFAPEKRTEMAVKKNISKGEQFLLDSGLYVSLPINMQILFTQSERDVLNTIRHLNNIGQTAISFSLLSIYTGLTDKTIKKAVDSLKRLEVIEVLNVCKAGTRYKINYKVLNNTIAKLNQEFNPVKRLQMADLFRGEGYELHKNTIEHYAGSEFENNRI